MTSTLLERELDPIGDARWARFVERRQEATVFHHPHWMALLRRQYGYRLTAWCVLDRSGAVVAGLPVAEIRSRLTGHRLVALPFSDMCVPLAAPDRPDARAALERMIANAQGAAGVPLDIHGPLEGVLGAHTAARFLHHRLDLALGLDAVIGSLKPATRRGVSKAQRCGLQVEHSTSRSALDQFYGLHLRTRRRQGVPTQPKRFISSFGELFDRGLGFVALVRHGQLAIAAAVLLVFNGTVVYKYGASDERFLNLRPNNLLFHDAISWAVAAGARQFDLGRTDLTNSGLASFKRGWGAAEELLAYTRLGGRPPPAPRRAENLLASFIRRTPRWTGRAIGELLYRHAG